MLGLSAADVLAIAMLAAFAAGFVVSFVRWGRRLPLTPAQCFWYAVNLVLARVLWRARISGPLPVPADQGAVIICNHRSPQDPSFIEIGTNRVVHWMVAEEFFHRAGFGGFLRMAEAIPVNRGSADSQAAKAAIRCAKNGGLVGLFPEGKINTTERFMLPGRPGAAMIALKARVPVIPCYIQGSPYDGTTLGCLLMPARVEARFGQPIDLSEYYGREDDREVLKQLTRQFLLAIAALAGETGFEPELAGRFHNRDRARPPQDG
jgi:1-acyl-sn-glycerol-3-phosphate acyltransferase